MHSHKMARARLAKPDLLANEVTGGDLIGVLWTPSTARIARGKFGRMCTYLKAIIHLVSHSRPDIFQPPMREVARSTRWAYFGHPGIRCRKYVRPLFSITLSGDLNSPVSQVRRQDGPSVRCRCTCSIAWEHQVTAAHFARGFRTPGLY